MFLSISLYFSSSFGISTASPTLYDRGILFAERATLGKYDVNNEISKYGDNFGPRMVFDVGGDFPF